MKKYDLISALSEKTAGEVTRNESGWRKYLNTAAALYKYPFKDQLLIYAQRPDATACASIEIWNEKMHCWVNKGAKGIVLIDEDGNTHNGLRYVFDISDVHKARWIGRFPKLWEMKEEHQEAVLGRLEETYGNTNRETGFSDRIKEIASRIAADCYPELVSEMEYLKEGSFLEELDQLNTGVRIRETLAYSIAYTVLKRCGMDEREMAEEFDFPYIHEFNTVETLAHIGNSITSLSKPLLMEIGKAIEVCDRENARNEVPKNLDEKVLANTSDTRYNALKRESEKQDGQSTTQAGKAGERGSDDEFGIREERGLPDPDVTDGRSAGRDADQVWVNEEELLTGTQGGSLHRPFAEREAERTPFSHPETGRGTDGTSGRADGRAGSRDGRPESNKPDAMGSEDERHQAVGGGNGADGTDLQPVNKEKITEKAKSAEPDSGESLSGFFSPETEKAILQFDGFMMNKCPDIAGYMLFEPDQDKQARYIKESYRHKEYSEFYVGNERAGYRADENGLTVWRGSYLNRTAEATLSWETVRERIADYMEKNEYLKEGQIPQWEEPEEKEGYRQLSLFPSFEEQIGTIEAAQAEEKHPMPAVFSLPQEQLESILRTGGGRDGSRKRIYAKYQQGKAPGEMAEFLKNEYQTTGKGFGFGNNPISVWFDEAGMRVGYGMSAKEPPVTAMDWPEVERSIRSMVENGTYMGANEAFLVDAMERQRVSSELYFFFREGIEEAPEGIPINNGNYPESITSLCELLSTAEGRERITAALSRAKEQLEAGEKRIRWRHIKSPEHLLSAVADLGMEKREYPVYDDVEVLHEDFITQDEIDDRLTGGSNFHQGKFRIYEHFMAGHGQKENADFLKKEYGTGGGSPALAGSDTGHEWHDAKGIRLEKGSYGDPYAKVLLKWNVVEKRISQLVKADRYLTPEGKEAYAQYKEERAEEAMRREQEKLERQQEEKGVVEVPKTEPEETEDITEKQDDFPDIDPKEIRESLAKRGIVDGQVVDVDALGSDPFIRQVMHDVEALAGKTAGKPEVDKSGAANFRIPYDEAEDAGKGFAPKEKFRQNVEAIKVLEKIEGEHRTATPEEQEILAKYVGWGGLADAFDKTKANWANEYQELKGLLSPEEYRSARESTLNAHYTSPVIIKAIFDAVGRMGFTKGNVLDPAAGIGNFYGCLPEKMQGSRLYGAELDGITGRIAKQLYPHADIKISGFENTSYPNDFFDVAVGNVPFGQYKVADKAYDKHNFLIHDYFFAKTLDKVRPGGVVAFVTSKGTMDKENPAVRKYLAQRAELLGAVRLPNTAFKGNAGTEVTSDILFLKKRDRVLDIEPDWVYLAEKDGIVMNQYFADRPEMVLGKMEMVSGAHGMEAACLPDTSLPLSAQLKDALANMEGSIEQADFGEIDEEVARENIPADPDVKNYSYTIVDSKVYYRENSIMNPVDVPEKAGQRIMGMVQIRN